MCASHGHWSRCCLRGPHGTRLLSLRPRAHAPHQERSVQDNSKLLAALSGAGASATSAAADSKPPEYCEEHATLTNSDRSAANPCAGFRAGQRCDYACGKGYLSTGDHVCHTDGAFRGGGCAKPACPLSAWTAQAHPCQPLSVVTDRGSATGSVLDAVVKALGGWAACNKQVSVVYALCGNETCGQKHFFPIGDTMVQLGAMHGGASPTVGTTRARGRGACPCNRMEAWQWPNQPCGKVVHHHIILASRVY